ncbi:hypothetical protein MFLAVUS_008690 [Mucor flavus]|uniref:C2H2-type domain-containing protein n=1 Tax=Mucor flavus TaxID=439312 RepID=A0ABP9Z7W5_9FUNG
MAHAIFNTSPVKFLSSIQDHVFTVTPTFKNKTYPNKSDKRKSYHSNQEDPMRNSSASPVTLQLTLPTESTENQMSDIQNPSYEQQQQQFQQQSLSPHVAPIDIPRSYPLNVPMNNNYTRGDYEGLTMPSNLLSTSYNSHHSYSYQDHNLVSLANSMAQSPYIPAEDLTVCFDGLAVRSPTESFYSNNGIYSPRQINSPINIGSPQNGYGSPTSPAYFGGGCSPQSTNFNHGAFTAGSPSYVGSPSYNNNNSYVGSPNSPSQFLGSPAMSPTFINNNDLGIDTSFNTQHELSSSYVLTYLSPSLQPQQTHQSQLSPINSPSPTGSYANNLYLFPPTTGNNYSRPSSPVPDDVILTATEVNDYINSPYLSATTPSPSLGQPLSIITDQNYDESHQISEFLFGNHNGVSPLTTDDMELYVSSSSSVVAPSSPHAQPQSAVSTTCFFSEDDIEEEEEDLKVVGGNTRKINMTTPSGRRAKIHKCPYCSHTSNRANNMREHIQIHNPNRPKPHACKLCNRAFARKHDMNRHYISCKKQHNKGAVGAENRYIITSPPLQPTT